MEKKVVVSKRFRMNSLEVFEYLIREYSEKTAINRNAFANNCTDTSMANAQPFATKLAPIEGIAKFFFNFLYLIKMHFISTEFTPR